MKPKYDKERIKEIASYIDNDEEKFSELFLTFLKDQEEIRNKYYQENPINAPNLVLNHAIVEGIAFNNDEVLSKGDFIHLLDIGHEKFYTWTYADDTESLLIVEVSPEVKENDLWKTATSILEIAFTISSQLEHSHRFGYDWIYRFNNQKDKEKQHYLKDRFYSMNSMCIQSINDFKGILNLIELLFSDDKYYVATQNIIAAKENHEFCQICALTPQHYRKHLDNEPEIWERAAMIPKMEAAIVQATRSVEAILGKPGDRNTPAKIKKVKDRWRSNINLEPDEQFKMVGKSYLDYYYDLFALRGTSAHSFGKLSFNMSRSLTIEAQSFAWIVIVEYFKKNCVTNEKASQLLNVNTELINRIPENYSTNKTKRHNTLPNNV
ncbi:hypothetical protein OKW21_001590 [Catalinimonas alkaloidigena]|uniref:hypothetical protein n=1 Tax=Catalinimonas alkaloidigena TaxID=1075417 RepID=UPI002404FC85|nr:hypothetical protein [Catalinimonas alkaloidigena]MDF9796327.1 hypothetical protein [Catalinimonas alkaloidigena]